MENYSEQLNNGKAESDQHLTMWENRTILEVAESTSAADEENLDSSQDKEEETCDTLDTSQQLNCQMVEDIKHKMNPECVSDSEGEPPSPACDICQGNSQGLDHEEMESEETQNKISKENNDFCHIVANDPSALRYSPQHSCKDEKQNKLAGNDDYVYVDLPDIKVEIDDKGNDTDVPTVSDCESCGCESTVPVRPEGDMSSYDKRVEFSIDNYVREYAESSKSGKIIYQSFLTTTLYHIVCLLSIYFECFDEGGLKLF